MNEQAAGRCEESDRAAIGAALIRSGVYDNDDVNLLQWHPCDGCPRKDEPSRGKCACSGVPYVSDAVWRELGPVIAAIGARLGATPPAHSAPAPWEVRAAATGGGPCSRCGKPFWTHVCLSCSPDYQTPGSGCVSCRNTGMDQTPCLSEGDTDA